MAHEVEKVAYESPDSDRGFTLRMSYLKGNMSDALIEVFRDGQLYRDFLYPAYKIWNIAAHFSDIVDGELAGHDGGYRAASWNGITPTGQPQPLPPANTSDKATP